MFNLSEEKRLEVERIKAKILENTIGENCKNVYYAIEELNDLYILSDNAIITRKNPAK